MSVKQLDTKQGKQGKNQEQTDSRPQVHSSLSQLRSSTELASPGDKNSSVHSLKPPPADNPRAPAWRDRWAQWPHAGVTLSSSARHRHEQGLTKEARLREGDSI